MGIFITHDKQNYDTIERVQIEYRGCPVIFRLKEYDLYERLLVFRSTERREGVTVAAYERETDDYMTGSTIYADEIASVTYAWDAECGPDHRLDIQVNHAWNEVRAEIDAYVDSQDEFDEVVETVTAPFMEQDDESTD